MFDRPTDEQCATLALKQAHEQLKFEPSISDAVEELKYHMECLASSNWCNGRRENGIEEVHILRELLTYEFVIKELEKS